MKKSVLATCLLFLLATPSHSRAQGASLPSFKHVFFIVLENTNYADAKAQPFFQKLAQSGAVLENFRAEIHPSQGNYIALISGSMNGVTNDGSKDVDAEHVGDLLEAHGLTWKVYAESYPGNCFQGAQSGTYVRKHNPFISFVNIQRNPQRCAQIVDSSQLDSDIAAGSLPAYSMYIPDLNNDGHDTGVAYAAKFLDARFGALLNDQRFMDQMLFIVTFDESGGFFGNRVYTAVYGDSVQPGGISNSPVTHYSLLKLVEDVFAIGNLGKQDASAAPVLDIWK